MSRVSTKSNTLPTLHAADRLKGDGDVLGLKSVVVVGFIVLALAIVGLKGESIENERVLFV